MMAFDILPICGRNAEVMCLWITLENIRIRSELYPKILGTMKMDLFNKQINGLLTWQMLYFGLVSIMELDYPMWKDLI